MSFGHCTRYGNLFLPRALHTFFFIFVVNSKSNLHNQCFLNMYVLLALCVYWCRGFIDDDRLMDQSHNFRMIRIILTFLIEWNGFINIVKSYVRASYVQGQSWHCHWVLMDTKVYCNFNSAHCSTPNFMFWYVAYF